MVATKPHIGLLGNGRVEEPTILGLQFREQCGIAVLLAEAIRLRVLAFEVKDINRKAYVLEEQIIPDKFGKRAIVIIEDMVGFESSDAESTLDEFLDSHWYHEFGTPVKRNQDYLPLHWKQIRRHRMSLVPGS